ncbi:MAG TPA: hypothetical protein P5527_03150 [Kiritimatiellia bacterium]|nr:hypothetical protein [Kiritimatiellia bacterium]
MAPLPPLTAAFQPPQPPPAAIPVEKPPTNFGSTTVPVTLSNGDITFFCPNCSCKLVVTERAAGKKIPCRKCNVLITVPSAAPIPPDPAGRQTVNLTFRQDTQASLSDLVRRVREGDTALAKAILAFGSQAVPIVIEGLENSFAEPKENRAADVLTDILVKIGAASVKPLISRLGKSRRAYYALGRIGTEEALQALIRELTSVNWQRVEAACVGLGLTENPNAAYVITHLENTRKTTQVGEVFTAAGSAIIALQRRLTARM